MLRSSSLEICYQTGVLVLCSYIPTHLNAARKPKIITGAVLNVKCVLRFRKAMT